MDLERGRNDTEGIIKRVSRLESGMSDVTRRIDLIAQAETFLKEADRVRERQLDERFLAIQVRFDMMAKDIKERADKQDSFMRAIALLAIGSILSFVITFALRGGFNAPAR